MRLEPLTLACVSVPRPDNLRKMLPIVLPYVDRCVLVFGERHPEFEQELKNLSSKIDIYYRPWDDNFVAQFNTYLKNIHEGWVLICYDDKTEVLTEHGWKLFKDLSKDEKVLTLNTETKALEYQTPFKYIDQNYDGDLLVHDGKSCNFAVTPDHKMYTSLNNNIKSPYKFIRAGDMLKNKKARFLCSGEWKGEKPNENIVKGIDNITLMRLLGWYLAEGCSYKQDFRHKIYLSQVKEEGREEIKNLIRSIGRSPIEDNDHTFVFYHRDLFDLVYSMGNKAWKKKIPEEIRNLDKGLLEELLSAYLRGDGTQDGRYFVTTSKELADNIQEICIKIGLRCSVLEYGPGMGGYNKTTGKRIIGRRNQYVGCLSRRINNTIYTENIEAKPYKGRVYCVTVPNGTLCVRRNGRAFFCGNCDDDEIPSKEALESMDGYINVSDYGRNFCYVMFRSHDVYDGVYAERPAGFWKQLLFKYTPNMFYAGGEKTGCHQSIAGHPHQRGATSEDVYYHFKSLEDEYQRASRNYFIYGIWLPGRETIDGERREEWHELKHVLSETYPEVRTFPDLDKILHKGNIDDRLKQWMKKWFKKFENHPEYNEMRALPVYYFRFLHPEEDEDGMFR